MLAILLMTIPRLWNYLRNRWVVTKSITKQLNNQNVAMQVTDRSKIAVESCYIEGYSKGVDVSNQSEVALKQSAVIQKPSPSKNTIEFYKSRTDLVTNYKTLINELKDAQEVWVAWWTGISAVHNLVHDEANISRRPPIDRMILIKPNGKYIKSFETIAGKSIAEIQGEIIKTYAKFTPLGVDIKFLDSAIEGMVITDSVKHDKKNKKKEYLFSDNAKIRIETTIPYKDYENCCNFVVKRNPDEVLFEALMKHYRFIWDNSEYPTKEEAKKWLAENAQTTKI